MMALKLLPVLQLALILGSVHSLSYPVYGTKRYGRASTSRPASSTSWTMPINYQQLLHNQRYPMNYYDMYPYNQNYPDEYYYPQESISYPVYYPPARTSKYEVYQAVLPYYYSEAPVPRMRYDYYGYGGNKDPLVDLEEEVLEEEREEREDSQPIGQEMYYENDQTSEENLDDVNAAFLQNLIMSEMYKNALEKHMDYYQSYSPDSDLPADDGYGKWEDYPTAPRQDYYKEDEDVKELKQLANPRVHKPKEMKPTAEDRLHLFQQGKGKNQNQNKKTNSRNENLWNNWENKRGLFPWAVGAKKPLSGGAAPLKTEPTPTTGEPSTTTPPKRDARGQKEEVLMRPATPVRHPFSDLNMMIDGQWKRTPSVYDTIKHMLDMERSLDQKYTASDFKPAMRKRIISSEDSLTRQLTVLKKSK